MDPKDFNQAHRAFDNSPDEFRRRNAGEHFTGASGVLFEQAMAQTRMAICLADPNAPDQPIVFANRAFRELTGYDEHEIVGKNCRFLQGPGTDPEQVAKIRDALDAENVVVVELLNYRRDGTPFWNALHLGPIYDDNGQLIYYFGSQWDVTEVHAARAQEEHAKAMSRELSHRMKNMFAVIGGIVSITGQSEGMGAAARRINDRIQALGRAYEPTLDEASLGTIEVGQAIRSVLAPYDPSDDRIRFLGNGVRTDPNVVSVLGLVLHELATNAVKYGSLSQRNGRVEVDWRVAQTEPQRRERLVVEWTEMDGPTVQKPGDKSKGTGLGIMETLLRAADAEVSYDWRPEGLHVIVTVPNGDADAPV